MLLPTSHHNDVIWGDQVLQEKNKFLSNKIPVFNWNWLYCYCGKTCVLHSSFSNIEKILFWPNIAKPNNVLQKQVRFSFFQLKSFFPAKKYLQNIISDNCLHHQCVFLKPSPINWKIFQKHLVQHCILTSNADLARKMMSLPRWIFLNFCCNTAKIR